MNRQEQMTPMCEQPWNMVPRSYEKGVVGSGVPSWGHIPSWTLQVQGPGLKPPLPALSQENTCRSWVSTEGH